MVELLEPWENWMPKNKVDPLSPTWLTIKKVELEALINICPDDPDKLSPDDPYKPIWSDKPKWLKQLKEVNRRLDVITKYYADKRRRAEEAREKPPQPKEPKLPSSPAWKIKYSKLSEEYRQTIDNEERKKELLEKMVEIARKNIYEKGEVCQYCHKPLPRPFPDPSICNECLKKRGDKR